MRNVGIRAQIDGALVTAMSIQAAAGLGIALQRTATGLVERCNFVN